MSANSISTSPWLESDPMDNADDSSAGKGKGKGKGDEYIRVVAVVVVAVAVGSAVRC